MNLEILSDKWPDDIDAKMEEFKGKPVSSSTAVLIISLTCNYPMPNSLFYRLIRRVLYNLLITVSCIPLSATIVKCSWNASLLNAQWSTLSIKSWELDLMLFDGLMQRGTMLPTSLFAIAFVRTASLVRCLINKLLKMNLRQPMMVALKIWLNSLTIFLRTFASVVTNYRHWNSLTSTWVFLFVIEWNGNRNFLVEIVSVYRIEDDDGQQQVKETPPNLSGALDMLQRLHLLASTEQSQLHLLISDLKSKLTDACLDSKVSKQNCIPDCFNKN